MEQTNDEKENDWAKTIKQEHIHITNAKSGKKGYYCLGCEEEMVAVKQKKDPTKRSYFRHWAKDVDRDYQECVVANRKYRERLAEQILHRVKSLPVPPVYKYPPKGTDNFPMLLEEKELVTAHKVKSQITFYEDDLGNIYSGKNPEIEDRHLLIRPDITFFDNNDNPKLLIEFVITHPISDLKRLKLQRLGINTVQIIIPKKPEAEIEKTLKSIRSTKWVYNETEANTNYVSLAKGNRERVLEIDELQRKLFEESYNCRAAQISWLIRAIKRNLGSEQYRRAQQLLEQKISGTEEATVRAREELEGLEKEYEGEIRSELQAEFSDEEKEFERQNRQFQGYRTSIEKWYSESTARYREEERELEKEEKRLDELIRRSEKPGETEESIRKEFRAKERELERDIRSTGFLLSKSEEQEAEIEGNTRNLESQIQNFEEYAREEERRIEREFEEINQRTIEAISQRNAPGNPELSERIEDVLRAGRISSNFIERQSAAKRTKEALDFVRGGTWKE